MKLIILSALLALATIGQLFAQVPQGFNYQAIARDSFGNPLSNRNVTARISINQGLDPGVPEYTEKHTATTNQFGLLTLKVGMGDPQYGSFAGIHWSTGNTYILVEFDVNAGDNFQNMGVTQLLSVPYAIVAGSSLSDSGSNSSPGSNAWSLSGNSNTTYGTDFIGTTDTQSIQFKVNNIKAGLIENSSGNTAFGLNVLSSNSSGQNNTALGSSALYSNSTGNSNIAIGISALYSNTSRGGLVAVGDSALYNNGINGLKATQAIKNTAIGSLSLFANTNGSYNTATGYTALSANVNGDNNAAFGDQSLSGNISGTGNTAIGSSALKTNITGDYNTAIGCTAFGTGTDMTNSTAIGYNTVIDSSNQVRIGNTSITSIGGQVGWTTYSDARVKNDVEENVPGLSFIRLLRPVSYHYSVKKEDELMGTTSNNEWRGKYDIEKITFSGFIAQEVDATSYALGYNFSGVDKSAKIWGIRYTDFIPSMVKSIQEQQQMIEKQSEDISRQQQEIEKLIQEIQELKGQAKLQYNRN